MDRTRRLAALARERTALIAYLRKLSIDEWQAPSRAQGWTVGDTVAHLGATTRALVGPGLRRVLTSGSAESLNDAEVARRRRWSRDQVLDEFVGTSATALKILSATTRRPLASLRVPIAELGRYPMGLTPSLLMFDWHVHLHHDIAPVVGRTPHPIAADSMAAVLEWMFAGMEQMNRHSMGWFAHPLSIELTGIAGDTWRIDPAGGGRLSATAGAGPAGTVAQIRSDSAHFPLWATTRNPWRDAELTITGDTDYAHRFLDSLNII